MPSERFFRLSAQKQAIIREAAIEEFARVPYEKVSINQIIQKADISRGSFYTYFEDKRDLLRYIFMDIKESMCNFSKDSINRAGGSLWIMMEDLLDFCMKFFKESYYVKLFKNVSTFPDTEQLLGFQDLKKEHDEELKRLESQLYELADKTDLTIEGEEEFKVLLDLCMGSLMASVGCFKNNDEDEEIIKKKFRKKLEMIRYGVCKR